MLPAVNACIRYIFCESEEPVIFRVKTFDELDKATKELTEFPEDLKKKCKRLHDRKESLIRDKERMQRLIHSLRCKYDGTSKPIQLESNEKSLEAHEKYLKIKSIFQNKVEHRQFAHYLQCIERCKSMQHIPLVITRNISEYAVGKIKHCSNIECNEVIVTLSGDQERRLNESEYDYYARTNQSLCIKHWDEYIYQELLLFNELALGKLYFSEL